MVEQQQTRSMHCSNDDFSNFNMRFQYSMTRASLMSQREDWPREITLLQKEQHAKLVDLSRLILNEITMKIVPEIPEVIRQLIRSDPASL